MSRMAHMRRALAAGLAVLALASLGSCAPAEHAVGDAASNVSDTPHDAVHDNEIAVGVVGSGDLATDRLVIDALDDANLTAYYASLDGSNDETATSIQSVSDMVNRDASIIVVIGIDVTDESVEDWNDALGYARESGIPVALLNPLAVPDDDLLYAASLTIDNESADATPLADVVKDIVRDNPHERTISVTANRQSS